MGQPFYKGLQCGLFFLVGKGRAGGIDTMAWSTLSMHSTDENLPSLLRLLCCFPLQLVYIRLSFPKDASEKVIFALPFPYTCVYMI